MCTPSARPQKSRCTSTVFKKCFMLSHKIDPRKRRKQKNGLIKCHAKILYGRCAAEKCYNYCAQSGFMRRARARALLPFRPWIQGLGQGPARFRDDPDCCMARSRARGAFRSMRFGGSSDVGRGGAQSPFSDPSDVTKHLTVSPLADPPAHSRYRSHCRRRHRRSHRRRAPLLRSDAT